MHDARLAGLEVTPGDETLTVGATVPLHVTARFTDGSTADVTHWTRFGSADETVAHVEDDGGVTVKGAGETAIAASFLTGVALARIRAPFPADVPDAAYTTAERFGPIDGLVLDKLRQLHIAPARLASDSTFIRRAYLDAAGILPTRSEVLAFLADTAPDKRARLVDRLLERDEFVDYWAYRVVGSAPGLPAAPWGGTMSAISIGWIRAAVKADMPWNRFVYAIATATGRTDENGAANYYLIHRSPVDLAENYTQAFLGLTLTCARCHNHPLEKWTQVDYYAFANLFARVSFKEDDTPSGKADRRRSSRRRTARSSTRAWAWLCRPGPSTPSRCPRARGRTDANTSPGWTHRPGEHATSPGRSSTGSGRTSSAAASSTRWTTCATRIPRRTSPSSRRWPPASSRAGTT